MSRPCRRTKKKRELRQRQLQTCIWLAEMRSEREVAALVLEHYPELEHYTQQAVHDFKSSRKWAKVIRYLRKKFLVDLLRIPIANKAIRLKRYDRVYRESMTESLKSRNQYGSIYELKLGAATGALDSAREEIEGKHPVHAPIQLNLSIVQHLHNSAKKHNLPEEEIFGTSDSKSKNRLRVIS